MYDIWTWTNVYSNCRNNLLKYLKIVRFTLNIKYCFSVKFYVHLSILYSFYSFTPKTEKDVFCEKSSRVFAGEPRRGGFSVFGLFQKTCLVWQKIENSIRAD